MCLCFGACIVKYILAVVNLVLTLIGLAITAIGVIALVELRNINVEELNSLQIVPTVIIVIGCIITVIFFLGCCGAITKNFCMLVSYSVIIVILACLTVALTVFISNNIQMVDEVANTQMTEIFNKANETGVLNLMESAWECCGTTGPESYSNSTIPRTCCPDALSDLQNLQSISQQGISQINISSISNESIQSNLICDINNAYQEGCVTKFLSTMTDALHTTVTVLICICIGEYLAGAMAIFLSCYIRRKK